jgi:hypothetical protein
MMRTAKVAVATHKAFFHHSQMAPEHRGRVCREVPRYRERCFIFSVSENARTCEDKQPVEVPPEITEDLGGGQQ